MKDCLENNYDYSLCKIEFYGKNLATSHKYYPRQEADWPEVKRNRNIVNDLLGQSVFLKQIHSNICYDLKTVPTDYASFHQEADGIVTMLPKINLVIQTADCVPVLFKCHNRKIIGACHAGWRGALSGVIENTIACLKSNGAENIEAFIGPCISQENYEVEQEFYQNFINENINNRIFFINQKPKENKYLFDLKSYVANKLEISKIHPINISTIDTYSDEKFFSYRRFCHHNQKIEYGSNLSIISLC